MSPHQPTDAYPGDHRLGDPTLDEFVVHDPKQLRRILISMITALVAVIASVSGLNVAQQQLAVDLGASQTTLLWIINGYTMVLAALLLPIGAIGDRFGRKPVLLAGLTVFAGASLVAALAGSATVMLLARLVAGAGAAMIMPVTLSVVTSSFPEDQRANAVGVWAGFAGAGGILGLFFSAAMVDWFSWRWLFVMPISLCAVALVLTTRNVENSREVHEHSFDVLGGVLSAIAIGGLVLAFHEGPEHGWTESLTVLGLVAGIAGTVAFVMWELRHPQPLLDVRLFGNRALASGSLNLFIVFAVMFGLFLVLVQFLQAVLGYSALRASAGLLPMAALLMPLSSAAPRIAQRTGTRPLLIGGTSVVAGGLVWMASMPTIDGGYLSVLPGLLLIGAGMGLVMTPSTVAITESLPAEKQGVASALNDTVREVGGAIGVALLGSVLSSGYRTNMTDVAATLPEPLRDPVTDGIGTTLAVAPQLGEQATAVVGAARQAFVDGWHQAMWVGAGLAVVSLVLLVVRGPKASPAGVPAADELVAVG
ncbi:MAG: MFS transporter [Acidimicrobiales bacterium]|nr:MFS transporter [Acidimicrobiales bacterium]